MEKQILELKQWIAEQLGTDLFELQPLKGDASFRTYFRVFTGDTTYIAMLAPVETENTTPFVTIARAWQQQGIGVPTIFGWAPDKGFVLLSDFGNTLLSECLQPETVDGYYIQAMQALLTLQKMAPQNLPSFNEKALALELSYFEDWFLNKLLGISLDKIKKPLLAPLFAQLISVCLEQDQVIVHRDYHSRNLMIREDGSLGLIDFQDAVIGPITYDLVSLLKDCYVSWPPERVMAWVTLFYQQLKTDGKLADVSLEQFQQWFHFVGLQRHLKVLGVFSRLKLRDNKPQYIQDMPRIMRYILQVTSSYDNFQGFHQWLEEEVMPTFERVCEEEKKEKVA